MSSPREFRIASSSICMMETSNKKAASVLSEADKKKSIAGSKYQNRKTVHNTLDSPFDIQWPKLDAEKENEALNLLKEFLSPARTKTVIIPKETLKSLPKKERKQWRKSQPKEPDERPLLQRPHCCIGLRDVVKGLEEGTAALVVCERNPRPPLLTKLLAPLCRTKSIPLVALSKFTATVTKVLNVPRCLTLALKVSATSADSPVHSLYSKLMSIYHEAGLMKVKTEDPEPKIETPTETEMVLCESKEPVDCQRFYLKRKASGGLSFVPGNLNPLISDLTANVVKTEGRDSTGYIILGSDEVPKTALLQPMRIKRLQSNEEKSLKKKQKTTNTPSKDQIKS